MVDKKVRARTWRTVACALGLSVAVHTLLLVLIQDRPGGASSLSGSTVLTAHFEPAPPSDVTLADPSVAPVTAAPAVEDAAPSRTMQQNAPASSFPKAPANETRASAAAVAPPPVKPVGNTGIEMPFVRDPTYYAMAALDTPPRLLGSAEGCYPAGAVGEVAFQLSINETGIVDEAVVVSVRPEGLFTGAAAEMCGRLKFSPATRGGRAVRSRIRLVVGQAPS